MPTRIADEIPNSDIVAAVAHWLAFESACCRDGLLNESSLRFPLGQVLWSRKGRLLVGVEEPYPLPQGTIRARGRPSAADFSIRRSGGATVLQDLVETKFITEKRVTFAMELLADLLRLEAAEREPNVTENYDRWLLVAGEAKVLTALAQKKVSGESFQSLVPFPPTSRTVPAIIWRGGQWVGTPWVRAATYEGLGSLPRQFSVSLDAHCEAGRFGCFMWRVTRMKKRRTENLPAPNAEVVGQIGGGGQAGGYSSGIGDAEAAG